MGTSSLALLSVQEVGQAWFGPRVPPSCSVGEWGLVATRSLSSDNVPSQAQVIFDLDQVPARD